MNDARTKRRALRALLDSGELAAVPGAWNALSARLVEEAGFPAVYMTGSGVANTLLGKPDVGLLTMGEMTMMAHYLAEAVSVPRHLRRRHRVRERDQRHAHRAGVRGVGGRGHPPRGPGEPQAVRPHPGQGARPLRGDGGEAPGRRGREAGRRARHHRAHRRPRPGRARRGDRAGQPLPGGGSGHGIPGRTPLRGGVRDIRPVGAGTEDDEHGRLRGAAHHPEDAARVPRAHRLQRRHLPARDAEGGGAGRARLPRRAPDARNRSSSWSTSRP